VSLLSQRILRLCYVRYSFPARLRSSCALLRLLWVLITPSLHLRPSFALPLLTDCPCHVLACSVASTSHRCWDQPLRSPLALSSQSVSVAPALPLFALSYLSSSHPPWPRKVAISAHASILMQLPRNHRDVHAMPAVGSHETRRL